MKWIGLTVLLILVGLIGGQWVLSGNRDISSIESIDGVPFPVQDDSVQIVEKLAHADVYLTEPVVGKTATLNIRFHPGNTNFIGVGVRENSFWLSYEPVPIWIGNGERTWQDQTVTIPLTNKFQEPDQSIDVMFFASTEESLPTEDEGANDTVAWQLQPLDASVAPSIPTLVELKDYIRSVLYRERAT